MRKFNGISAGIGYPGAIALAVLLVGLSNFAFAQRWVPEGHAPAHNGQLQAPFPSNAPGGIPNKPVAGAIEAVVVHPTDPDIIWAGSVNGGIFRTTNALAETPETPNWIAQTDTLGALSIGALELDPTDVTNNTLVAGIANTSSYGSLGSALEGIMRTLDGGLHWATLPSVGILGSQISGVAPRGTTIVVSSFLADSGAAGTGIFRSTDNGFNFVKVSGTGLPLGAAFDLASDPTNSSRLFTIIQGVPGNTGIYRSDDTGATWTQISSASFETLLNAGASEANIVVGRAGPTTPNVFAVVCDSDGALAGVQHTGDGAAGSPSWTALDVPTPSIHTGGQCGIHLSLAADPTNSDVAYVGGDYLPNKGPHLRRIDGSQVSGSQVSSIMGAGRTANDTAPHSDSREMVFDANGDLVEVDDGGIFKHTNPGGTDGDWVSLNGNIAVAEMHNVAYDSVSNIVFSGNQDNGTTRQVNPTSTIWTLMYGGDGGDVAVAENDPIAGQSTRYYSAQYFGGGRREVYDSANQKLSTVYLNPLSSSADKDGDYQFITPIKVNSEVPSNLIMGAKTGVYESKNKFDSVTMISDAVINWYVGGNTISYGMPSAPSALYFASGDKVWVRPGAFLTDPTETDPNAVSGAGIRGVLGLDSEVAYAIDSTQVYRTLDGGASWQDLTANLQSLDPGSLRSIAVVTEGLVVGLVVGTDTGVFITSDFITWTKYGTGLPNVPVMELDYDAADDVLTAGTLGRGAWTLTTECSLDAFEPDNSLGQASSLIAGEPQGHSICEIGERDWATFTLIQDSSVTLLTSGPYVPPSSGVNYDTRMWLRNSAGVEIEENNDYDEPNYAYYSRIDRTCDVNPLPAGTYYVEVAEFGDNAEIQPYELTLTTEGCFPPDPDLVVENPNVVVLPPSPSDGTNGVGLEVNPSEALTASATVRNQGTTGADATTLRWYLSSDPVIATSDTELATSAVVALNTGLTFPASEEINAPVTPGTYFFGACVDTVSDEQNTVNNCSTGVEVIVIAPPVCIDDEFETQGFDGTDDTCYGVHLPYETAQSHMLCDEDWVYAQPTVVGSTYRIETTNLTGGADTFISVHDSCGPELASDDNSGAGAGSLIEWTAQSTILDIRVVQAGGVYTTPGGYDITVSCIANCGGEPVCYDLTLSHTGLGLDPVATPANSTACPGGGYVEGEVISLSGATPDAGWAVTGWSGTDNDASVASTNIATMPAGNLAVSVVYEEVPACIDDEFENTGGGGTDDTCYGTQLTLETAQSHMLCDEDWVAVEPAVVGSTYRIETTNLTGGADTFISVHNNCEVEPLATDDNSGAGAGSLIEWTAQSTILDIRVVQAGGVYTTPGGYDITVSCIANCGGEPVCYDLTLSHTGLGLDPIATPANSTACPDGGYVEGEVISLSGATPDASWAVAGWSGTDNDASIESTNTATMPAGNLAVSVAYEEVPVCIDDEFENAGSDGTDDTCFGKNVLFATAQTHMLCDEDWVTTNPIVIGATYRVETTNLTGGADTLISLHNTCGPELASDDNSGAGAGSLIEWTADGGIFDIRVVQAGGVYTTTGGYDITISCIANCDGNPVCYDLTLSHTGLGLDPVASPANSTACPGGGYVEGEVISLSGATPDVGWAIAGWSGTDNDASIASTNTATMPAGNLAVSVAYEGVEPIIYIDGFESDSK